MKSMDDAEYAALMNALAEAMKLSIQSVRQSTALSSLLAAKGVVTQGELDEAMKPTAEIAKTFLAALDPNLPKKS